MKKKLLSAVFLMLTLSSMAVSAHASGYDVKYVYGCGNQFILQVLESGLVSISDINGSGTYTCSQQAQDVAQSADDSLQCPGNWGGIEATFVRASTAQIDSSILEGQPEGKLVLDETPAGCSLITPGPN